jgi:nucleoside-diphosphate-sugar epimerase
MQNVLVIGAGRVGKGISTELTNKGYSVENYSSKELEANSNLPFSLFDFDTFYWCARESGIPTDISNTGKLFSTLLFEIEKLRWKGLFVFLSSAGEVYGEGLGYPAFEKSPLKPISDYGRSKVRNEVLLMELANSVGFHLLIARISSVYELQIEDPGIFGAILRSLYLKHELTIVGGHQSRDFIHLQDVINCLIVLAEGKNYSVFNLATGISITIFDLVKIFEDEVGPMNQLTVIDRVDGIQQSHLSIEKIKAVVTDFPQPVREKIGKMIFKI